MQNFIQNYNFIFIDSFFSRKSYINTIVKYDNCLIYMVKKKMKTTLHTYNEILTV